jgi:hypothetical protein
VIQEVGLGQDQLVVCGKNTIQWYHILLVSGWFTLNWQEVQLSGTIPPTGVQIPLMIHFDIIHCNALSPSQLLSAAHSFKATDPRDMVFALLAFKPLAFHPVWKITADYQKTLRQVFIEAFMACVFQSRALDVLTQVYHGESIDQTTPSWVPRWDLEQGTAMLQSGRFDATKGVSGAYEGEDEETVKKRVRGLWPKAGSTRNGDGKWPRVLDDMIRIDPDAGVLSVRGILIGEVWTHTMALKGNYWMPFKKIEPLIVAVIRMCCEKPPEPTGDEWYGKNVLQIIAAVCTAGRLSQGDLGPETDPKDLMQHTRAMMLYAAKLLQDIQEESGENSYDGILKLLSPPDEYTEEHFKQFESFMLLARTGTHDRRLFRLTNGVVGNGPVLVEKGDVVAVLFGTGVPFVLRPNGNYYQIIGACYVFGYMHGEAVDEMAESKKEVRWFDIR